MQAGDWLLRRALSESGLAGGGDGSDRWPSCRRPAGAMWSGCVELRPGAAGATAGSSRCRGPCRKTDAGPDCGSVLKLFNTCSTGAQLHSHRHQIRSGARPGPPDGGWALSPRARGLGVPRAGGRRFRGRGRDAVWSGGPRSATRGGRGRERLVEPLGPRVEAVGKAEVVRGHFVGVATLTATPGMGCRPQAAASSR